jgi:hypothetical protein
VYLNVALPTLTSVLALLFGVVLLLRFTIRRQPYVMVWTLGLVWYALAAGTEAVGGALGWTPTLYRIWYATGAIGVAAYLGAGVLYLHRDSPFGSLTIVCVLGASVPALATNHLDIGFLGLGSAILLTAVLSVRPEKFPQAVTLVLVVASLAAAYRVFTAPVDNTLLPLSADQIVTGDAFDSDVRTLAAPFNIAGASILVLGASISALSFWRRRGLASRVLSNSLITAGALVGSGTGLTRFGVTSLFLAAQLLGLAFIFAGFLLSDRRPLLSPWSAGPPRSR